MQTISVKFLRENFSLVRERLKNGFSFLLIYRSEPIGKLEPINFKNGNKLLSNLLTLSDKLKFTSTKSAVDLVRKERD